MMDIVSDSLFIFGVICVLLSIVMFKIALDKYREKGEGDGFGKRGVCTLMMGLISLILSYFIGSP
ncbi:MAG: hypothetical protein J7L52_06765 [Thermotogae bacterium]|nr:hypothetical protein [Thermotogota bacterium]